MSIKKIFPKPLKGKFINEKQYKLSAPFVYDNPPVYIKVPKGFVTDGASIPRIAWTIIGSPFTGRYRNAAVIHDYLYTVQTCSRWQADRIFYQAMRALKVSPWRRSLMHLAVRSFGWIPWGNYKRKKGVHNGKRSKSKQ